MFKKSLVLSVFSAFLMSASFAMADSDLNLTNSSADLGNCGGSATLVKTDDGRTEVHFSNVKNCSNLTLQMKLDRNELSDSNEYTLVLPVVKGRNATVQLSSNSGQHSTALHVDTTEREVLPQLFAGDTLNLNNCFGTVYFASTYDGSVRVIFRDVKNCMNLRALENNGSQVYWDKKLQDQGSTWGGSFDLPRYVLRNGKNKVKISLEGYLGNKDQFVLNFDSYTNY